MVGYIDKLLVGVINEISMGFNSKTKLNLDMHRERIIYKVELFDYVKLNNCKDY